MAKFDRKVKRQRNEYSFTKKEEIKKTKLTIFKENFSFSWIPRKWSSLAIVALVFVFVTFTVIPLLMQNYNEVIAMLVGHGIVTPILMVITFNLSNKDTKPSLKVSCIRCLFLAVLLILFSMISLWVL